MQSAQIARLVSFNGRAGRLEFAATIGFLALAWTALALTPWLPPSYPAWIAVVVLFAPMLLVLPVIVRRMHDVNISVRWAWAYSIGIRLLRVILPVAGVHSRAASDWTGLVLLGLGVLYLALAPGAVGENDFGAPPQRSHTDCSAVES